MKMGATDYKLLLDEVRRDYKSRDRIGRWSVGIGAAMVAGPSVAVLSGDMTMNAAFGWVALGLLVSIVGATYVLKGCGTVSEVGPASLCSSPAR
jgi:hypothetical protein